jgi:hypothetical protein
VSSTTTPNVIDATIETARFISDTRCPQRPSAINDGAMSPTIAMTLSGKLRSPTIKMSDTISMARAVPPTIIDVLRAARCAKMSDSPVPLLAKRGPPVVASQSSKRFASGNN